MAGVGASDEALRQATVAHRPAGLTRSLDELDKRERERVAFPPLTPHSTRTGPSIQTGSGMSYRQPPPHMGRAPVRYDDVDAAAPSSHRAPPPPPSYPDRYGGHRGYGRRDSRDYDRDRRGGGGGRGYESRRSRSPVPQPRRDADTRGGRPRAYDYDHDYDRRDRGARRLSLFSRCEVLILPRSTLHRPQTDSLAVTVGRSR